MERLAVKINSQQSKEYDMKILCAPDSYKGSMSSVKVAEIMKNAFRSIVPDVKVDLKPMADGGEGTLHAMWEATEGEIIEFDCKGPLGHLRKSRYLELADNTAVIEGAEIAGLPLVPKEQRNPDWTTTYGIGEAIIHALNRGNKKLILALGGSSSNDGGLGMFQALGVKAFDIDNQEVGILGKDLFQVDHVDFGSLDSRIQNVQIQVACDVDNPLTGPKGASHVYGPQKGADERQVIVYDEVLLRYSRLVEEAFNESFAERKGAGAAGGLGFAFLALGGELHSGAELVSNAIKLPEAVNKADLILTGEGQSDEQTLYGKAPGFVAELAVGDHTPVILLSGSIEGQTDKLNKLFTGCFSIVPGPRSLEDCMENGETYLYQLTQQIAQMAYKLLKE